MPVSPMHHRIYSQYHHPVSKEKGIYNYPINNLGWPDQSPQISIGPLLSPKILIFALILAIPGHTASSYTLLNGANPLSTVSNFPASHMVTGSNQHSISLSARNHLSQGGCSLPSSPWAQCVPLWIPTTISNQAIKSYNGNAAKGIKIITWNKGSANLERKMDTVKQLIQDEAPHVLALHEAQVPASQDLGPLAIQDYSLYLDGLYAAGKQARSVVYVHRDLTVTQRADLQNPELALVALSVGRPRQKKFNILSFYHQWHIQHTDAATVKQSNLIRSQAARFEAITNIWERSIDEGSETITLSDSNLQSELLTDQPGLPVSVTKYRQIAKHFTNKIMPKGVAILNKANTHFHPAFSPSNIDHITTTNPSLISNISTKPHGESHHCYLTCIKKTKASITQPRYKNIRNYRDINPMEMQAMIWQSEDIKFAATDEDPNLAAEALIRGLNTILDCLAPKRRIQLKTNHTPYLSEATRDLRTQRDETMKLARISNNPEDWREYRRLRNRATQSSRNDQFVHIKNKVSSPNPSTVWNAVNKLTGGKLKGPPLS